MTQIRELTKAHIDAHNKAKIELMARPDSAFFTTICFSMKHEWDWTIPTACTDGTKISFNPDFFMSLDIEERVFLMLHESMHVAYLHMIRLMERDHGKWNIACDHVINLQLIARKFKMPSIGLADSQYAGMSVEQVYDLLPDDPLCDSSMLDLKEPPDGEISDQISAEVADILVRAQIQSKISGDAPGTIPGEIQIYLDGLLEPKLPWNRILQKYLQNFAKNDYSFRKPSRRFFPKYHLPSLIGESLIDLAIAVDTSGSVSDSDFHYFMTETASILKMMKPGLIRFIQFDTAIKSVDKIKNVKELLSTQFVGRGGTCIGPVIDWAMENKPQLLLIFSDGEFHHVPTVPKCQVIWLIHNNPKFTAPFGKVIHYSI